MAIPASQASDLSLGILNTIGDETDSAFFKVTERYLKERFKDDRLIIKKYDLKTLEKAIKDGELNFFISNPGFYASTQEELNTTIIASKTYSNTSLPDRALGSVFVTLNSETHLNRIEDLQGKTACSVAPNAYGGLYIAYGELLKRKFKPEEFFSHMVYTGYPMPKVFDYLQEGRCEVGLVRTCLLEDLIRSGKIEKDRFKVIEPKPALEGFSCARSTDLYPGWVIAATKETPYGLKKELTKVLFQMPEVAGSGWTVSGNFNPVNALYRDLKVGHYEYLRDWNWAEFLREHWELLSLFLFIGIAGASYTKILQTQVKRKTVKLEKALQDKDREHKAVENAKRHLADLEKVSMVGMLSSMIAHELRQPLAVIRNYCEGVRTVLNAKTPNAAEASEALELIDEQAAKASKIIEHMRSLVKSKELRKETLDMRVFVPKVVKSFERLGGDIKPTIRIDLSEPMFSEIDPVQLEIVLLNLLNNAAEAIHQQKRAAAISLICQKEDGVIQICVINEGAITCAENFEDLFRIKRSSKESGLGLGLAISARIVESYGGSLRIEAKDDKVYAWVKIPAIQSH